jgi:hypothetical protein
MSLCGNAAGNLTLGIYDAGLNGGPGKLMATTASFAPETGSNIRM